MPMPGGPASASRRKKSGRKRPLGTPIRGPRDFIRGATMCPRPHTPTSISSLSGRRRSGRTLKGRAPTGSWGLSGTSGSGPPATSAPTQASKPSPTRSTPRSSSGPITRFCAVARGLPVRPRCATPSATGTSRSGASSSAACAAQRTRKGRRDRKVKPMSLSCGKIRVEELENGEEASQMAKNVRAGLLSTPKDLSPWPKYFYDERGSKLFEEITTLPEYYQARTELSILEEKAPEIVAHTRCQELVELGSGSASKTRPLLDAMAATREEEGPEAGAGRYVPLDISESALRGSARGLLEEYPTLDIFGFVGDFERSLKRLLVHPRWANAREVDGFGKLVIFLGGTLGNFTPQRQRAFLSTLRAGLKEGDYLLVGVDLVKDPRILEAAYDDAMGVTASFNKNLLKVLNRRLGGEFDPELFVHRAFYNPKESRIEMWLDSKVRQKVLVAALGLEVPFEAGEGMRTEISAKFTLGSVADAFKEADIRLLELCTDEENLFGLALGAAR